MQINRRDFLQAGIAAAALPRNVRGLVTASSSRGDELWYTQPARRWLQALPVGNGRIGAMVFGGIEKERIALSESTAWSGAPSDTDVNPEALAHLGEIRALFFAGKAMEARALCEKYLLGHARSFGTNLPLPELQLDFEGSAATPPGFRRSLDLDTGVALVEYGVGPHRQVREVFASNPDDVLVLHLSGKSASRFRVSFSNQTIPCEVRNEGSDTLVLRGHAYEKMHSDGTAGVSLEIRARVLTDGGSVTSAGEMLSVQNTNSATLLLAIATDFAGKDPQDACRAAIERASGKAYARLRNDHVADHQALYRRTTIDLGTSGAASRAQPTDLRRKALERGGEDPELLALFFQYGRYLTIAGSRANSPLPLALQGIWNDGLASSMGWTDDFHLDINTQQNYWPAEVCNLSECQTPLFGFLERLQAHGRRTAKEMYGAPGWVAHTVTNPWGYTAPGWGLGWGLVVVGGLWLALQLWDHYTFTGDTEFLRTRAYPILRGAAEFFFAYMVPEPTHGWLVTGPSDSPENTYLTASGERCSESMGPTCDRVLVHALYSMCIEASASLGIDAGFRASLEEARAKLPPLQIGRHGRLQEWLQDYEDADPNHRHTSHLIALYPEHQIAPRSTPELARAAEITIERRLNTPNWEQSEWGRANLVVYYARLLKADQAHTHLKGLVAKAADDNLLTYSSGGVAGADQNIFAIDGNTAGCAGVAEMLLQSQGGEIELLPALPGAWPNGSVHGLCARGAFTVDIAWHGGALLSASILSHRSGSATVRYGDKTMKLDLRAGESKQLRLSSFRAS